MKASTFKIELARFRADLEHYAWFEGEFTTRGDTAFLNRWAADPRAEDIWKKVQSKINLLALMRRDGEPYPECAFFIAHALRARSKTETEDAGTWAQLSKSKREHRARYLELARHAEALVDHFRQEEKRPRPPRPGGAIAKKEPHRWESYQRDAEMFRREADNADERFGYVSRIDRNGSRRRTAFMRSMSWDLFQMCGESLDDVVAFLTDIAFPGQETTIDMVRSARRARRRRSTKPDVT